MGWSALRQRYATLPGVSLPSSVVRSHILTASLSPASLALVLMLRLPKDAARSSTITASMVGTARLRIANCELRIGNADRSFDNADTFIFSRNSEGEIVWRQF